MNAARKVRSWSLAAVGVLLVAAAALVSNGAIERALTGAAGGLSWGPTLFRALLAFHGLVLIAAGAAAGPPTRKREPPADRVPRAAWAVLIALTAIALVLRLVGLNTCLWLDEILTMVRFARPPLGQIVSSFPNQNQHMLYSVLAHVCLRLFGEQAWALRLPSVLFGVGSLWTLFPLGRRVAGTREALLACALMTVSYHHIWFSQNARGYMGLLFFTNLATWLWLEAQERGTWTAWLGYAAAVFFGLWIHMTMLFVLAAHVLITGIVWLRARPRDWRALARPAAACILCGTVTLQVYALTLPEFLHAAAGEVSMPSQWTNPLWVVTESLRSLRIGFAGAGVVLCGGLLVLAGWLGIVRRDWRAALAMVLPGLFGGISMLVASHNLWPRFFFFSMGFGLLIVVHGALLLPRLLFARAGFPPRRAMAVGYALTGMIIVASALTVPRCYALPKQDFTSARDFAERQQGSGDVIVTVGLADHAYSQYYAPAWPVAHDPEELAALRRQHTRTFLVYTLPTELQAFHPALWRAVQAGFEVIKIFPGTLGGGAVYVCRERRSGARRSAAR